MNIAIAALGFGIVTAAILSLGAVGFTLQYGVTNVLNLAIAGVMSGAEYVSLEVNRHGGNIWMTIAVGAAFGAVASYALNRFIYMPFIRRGVRAFAMVIISLAVWTIIQYVVLAIVGPGYSSLTVPVTHTYSLGAIRITGTQISVVLIAIVALLALEATLKFTLFGKAIRATATNAPLARASGVNVGRVIDLTWLISGVFSGIAGVVIAITVSSFSYSTAGDFLVPLIAAAILGGVGRPLGAMVGALIVGVVSEVGAALTNPSYKNVIAFAMLGIVLVVRPSGLFPEPVQRKDVVL